MRTVLGLLLLSGAAAAQAPADWKAWAPLVGEWVADPTPDGATGGFTLAPELQGRVLVRHNRAVYPKSTHDDLLVVYREGGATRADYWDSEGHVIRYAVTTDGKTWTFLSDAQPGRPRFRLTWEVAGAALTLHFEIAPPDAPAQFKPYITATLRKKK